MSLKRKIAKHKVKRRRKAYEKEVKIIQQENLRANKAEKEAWHKEDVARARARREKAEAKLADLKAKEAKKKRLAAEKRKSSIGGILKSMRKGFRQTQKKLGYR